HLLGLSVVAAERADLDEVDVAGRVLRPGPRVVPDTRVVRDEVAGLYVQLLEVERVAGGDARPAFTRSEQLDGPLVAAVHAEDQLEGADPVVVLGAALDEPLVHGAGARVAAGLAQHDDGRLVLQDIDRVLGRGGTHCAVWGLELDAVEAGRRDGERAL